MVTFSACALACLLSGTDNVVLMEFTADWCGACRSAEPTVQRLISEGYPVHPVNIDREPQTAAKFRVTSVPCFVLVVGGQEVDRVLGAASYGRLTQMLERASKSPSNQPSQLVSSRDQPFVRGQSPDAGPRFGLPRPLASIAKNLGNRGAPQRPASAGIDLVQMDDHGTRPSATTPSPTAPSGNGFSLASPASPEFGAAKSTSQTNSGSIQSSMRATVRLRIEDSSGHSVGTGTIIDSHGNESLIVTCGHIFRDSKGKGRILVDIFAENQTRSVEGTIVSYDLDRDIALVSIVPGTEIAPALVAPPGFNLAVGQPVFSVGCDQGTNPSVRESSIKSIDRYVGSPNLEVAGTPAEGRSGGGLFSTDGYLIGVCNAADPQDQEGIFASLPIIHWELDKIGQREIYDTRPKTLVASAQRQEMSREMPRPNTVIDVPAGAREVPEDMEVICIVRSRSNPQASQQLMVLDRPSREFFDRLKSESQRRPPTDIASQDRFDRQTPTIRAQSDDR